MPDIERRYVPFAECRIASDDADSPTKITGYAAVFDKLSVPMFGFREKIKRGAFKDSIKTDDIRALVDHDPSRILGRNTAGTLKLKEDRQGLAVEIDIPDTTTGRDTAESIRRGDLDGMSFGFYTIDDRWETKDGEEIRTLLKAELFDVSVVAFPAYPDTSAGVRKEDLEPAVRSLEAWRAERKSEEEPVDDTASGEADDDYFGREIEDLKRQFRLHNAD